MPETLGSAVLDLRTDQSKFDRGMDRAKKKATELNAKFKATSATLKKLGSSLQSAGVKMTAFVTAPIVALGALAVKLADVQIQAEAGLAAALTFTGVEAQRVLPDLKAFASGLQDITTVGDEVSLQMLQVGISMGLSAESAKGAVKEAIGLSKAFGIAENTAVRMTASLAAGDTTMLNRYIPALKMVEDEAERVALAHKLLAGAFTVAVAEASNGLGPWKQLGNLYGDVLEDLGKIILEGLEPLVGVLKTAILWVQNLSDGQKRWIVTIAAVLAAIGPILIAIGSFLVVLGSLGGMLASGGVIAVGMTTMITAVTAIAPLLGTAALALGAFWAGWKAGEFLAEMLGIQENALAGWLDAMGFFGPSIQEIIADTNESAVAFGTYRTAAQIAADETERLAKVQADELAAALKENTPLVTTYTAETDKETVSIEKATIALGVYMRDFVDLTLIHTEAGKSILAALPAFEDTADVLSEFAVTLPKVVPPLVDLDVAMNQFGVRLPNVSRDMARLTLLVESGKVPQAQLAVILKQTGDEYARLGVLTPEVADELKRLGKEAGIATLGFGDLFLSFTDGFPAMDGLLGKFKGILGIFSSLGKGLGSLGGKFGSFFSKLTGGFGGGGGGGGIGSLFGGLFGKIKGMFGGGGTGEQVLNIAAKDASGLFGGLFGSVGADGATSMLGGLSGILGKAASFLPIVGPLISAFGPILFKGLKALGGKIFGAIKSMFGGPDAAEQAGRKTAADFIDATRAGLDAETIAVIALQFPNDARNQRNAAFLASIGKQFEATGLSAEAAGAKARMWGAQLSAAEKQGGDAVQRVIDGIAAATAATVASTVETTAAVQEAMKETVDASKANTTAITDDMKTQAATASTTAADMTAAFAAAAAKIVADDKLAAFEKKKLLADLATANAAALQKMVSDTAIAQETMASIAIGAAAATEDAWVKSASNTAAAWARTRALTVGQSSILDIEVHGSEAARRLADSHADAARQTEEEWKRVNRDIAMDRVGHDGDDGDRRRRARDRAMDFGERGGDSFRSSGGGGGGRGGGRIVIELVLDRKGGELLARRVVKLTPAILQKLGLV